MVNDKFPLGNRLLHPEVGNDCRIPGFIEKSNIVKLHFVCDNFFHDLLTKVREVRSSGTKQYPFNRSLLDPTRGVCAQLEDRRE